MINYFILLLISLWVVLTANIFYDLKEIVKVWDFLAGLVVGGTLAFLVFLFIYEDFNMINGEIRK